MARLTLSTSSLQQILFCPYSYYLAHILKEKGYMSYPTLLGQAVHRFINFLYSGKHPDRPFFYKGLEPQARSAWFRKWSDICANPPKEIRFPDKIEEQKYGAYGWICVKNYWQQNIDKPVPLYSEKRIKFPILAGVDFVGVFDQIRELPIDVIKKFNPGIIRDGVFVSGYANVVIVDLKTNIAVFESSLSDVSKVEEILRKVFAGLPDYSYKNIKTVS